MKLTTDEIKHLINIGFCQPKFYKASVWKKAKTLMLDVCKKVPEVYYEPIRGKGQFWIKGDMSIEKVIEKYLKKG